MNLILFKVFKIKFKFAGASALVAAFLLLSANQAMSQPADTSAVKPARKNHSPGMATLCSAIIPGLGQVYNKKYWKVPFIYGFGGTLAYFVGYNQHKYQKFRSAIVNGTPGTRTLIDGQFYSFEILPRGRDYYRRYRDLSVLGMGFVYFLNIVDAMIDAQFFNYDISDDLTLRINPAFLNNNDITSAVGFRIDIDF